MKLVADENISFGKEAFSEFGEVIFEHGRKITNAMLKDADALITRSITKVNEELLSGTNVKFVGTATIGTDHIDLNYLQKNGIAFSSAAGCNSNAVKEYVLAAVSHIYKEHGIGLENKSIGVIGVGNIGSKVAAIGETLGLKVVRNDPPLQRLSAGQAEETGSSIYSSLEEALKCDIITCHVPLNLEGIDKTYHLINEETLRLIKPGALLINSSRGPVVDNKALRDRLEQERDIYITLDVWENEPGIDNKLMNMVNLATPHIAGYSLEGKVNGTTIVYNTFCNYLGREPEWSPQMPEINNRQIDISGAGTTLELLNALFSFSYPIIEDDKLLREQNAIEEDQRGSHFDALRKNYRFRRELQNYQVPGAHVKPEHKNIVKTLGLKVI
jgi:erythronate-4-phosphate dehydrogenase